MYIRDCMTKDVKLGSPDMYVAEAAELMRAGDIGILPIASNDRLVGMLTDRDIVTRCIALDKDINEAQVAEIMTDKVLYCFDDQTVDEVLDSLGHNQLWRMPVLNRDKMLVGILSLCDLTKSKLDADLLEQTIFRLGKKHKHILSLKSKIEEYEQFLT